MWERPKIWNPDGRGMAEYGDEQKGGGVGPKTALNLAPILV